MRYLSRGHAKQLALIRGDWVNYDNVYKRKNYLFLSHLGLNKIKNANLTNQMTSLRGLDEIESGSTEISVVVSILGLASFSSLRLKTKGSLIPKGLLRRPKIKTIWT